MENELIPTLEESMGLDSVSHVDRNRLQNELWMFLGRKTLHYTMGDSASVPVEKAEELMRSIVYLMRLGLSFSAEASLERNSVEELHALGTQAAQQKIALAKDLFAKVRASQADIDNLAYHHSLEEISLFFQRYDITFLAHDIPCMIDYPLVFSPEGLEGITYIMEYLTRLSREAVFLNNFSPWNVRLLLQAYSRDYRQDIINLYEPVAVNAIGLVALNKDPLGLHISTKDCAQLKELFLQRTQEERADIILKAADSLTKTLNLSADADRYVKEYALELSFRLNALIKAGCALDGLFLSFEAGEEADVAQVVLEDGKVMSDEQLRDLMEELRFAGTVSGKITLVKEQVHSMQDLLEILHSCFWGEDAGELLKTLTKEEQEVLQKYVAGKREAEPYWRSNTGWEDCLQCRDL